jgi:ferredoxin-NADP reductase
MPGEKRKFDYILVSKKKEAEGIVTLKFKPQKAGKISFIPGQYVVVYLKNESGPKGKPYTISSIPDDKFLSITVKKAGEFSTALHNLIIGESVTKTENLFFWPPVSGWPPFLASSEIMRRGDFSKTKKSTFFIVTKPKKI